MPKINIDLDTDAKKCKIQSRGMDLDADFVTVSKWKRDDETAEVVVEYGTSRDGVVKRYTISFIEGMDDQKPTNIYSCVTDAVKDQVNSDKTAQKMAKYIKSRNG